MGKRERGGGRPEDWYESSSAFAPASAQPPTNQKFWRVVAIMLGALALVATTAAVTITLIRHEDRVPDDIRPTQVASASTTKDAQETTTTQDSFSAPTDFADVFKEVKSGIVRIETLSCSDGAVGTGFLITPTLVVTAAHVVKGTAVISLFANDETASGTVVGYSPSDDLALVKTSIPVTGHYFTFAKKVPDVGDPVAAIGFPIGLPMTLTAGTVSGLNRSVNVNGINYFGLLQTDAAVNPGNSGGPLVNAHGEVTAVLDITRVDATGIAYGVPSVIASARVETWQSQPTPVEPANCGNPTGNSTGRPELQPPSTLPASVSSGIATAFNTYFDGINTGDYGSAFQILSQRQRTESGYTGFVTGVKSSFDFDQRVLAAQQIDSKTVRIALSFTSLQAPSKGPDGEPCTHWTLEYRMVLESDDGWHIDGTKPYFGKSHEPC